MFEGLDWSPVVNAALLLLAAVIATLRPAVVAFLKAKASEYVARSTDSYAYLVQSMAHEAVRAAEQIGGTAAEKKLIAINYVTKRAADMGLDVDPEVVDAVIESAVYGLQPKGE